MGLGVWEVVKGAEKYDKASLRRHCNNRLVMETSFVQSAASQGSMAFVAHRSATDR